jgi:hypothetical protein
VSFSVATVVPCVDKDDFGGLDESVLALAGVVSQAGGARLRTGSGTIFS